MAFGPDSIKATPSVTYDLSLFVLKRTDSVQIHRDVTKLYKGGFRASDLSLVWKLRGFMSLLTTCWMTKSLSRVKVLTFFFHCWLAESCKTRQYVIS